MPLLRGLTPEESEALIHKLRNEKRNIDSNDDIIQELVSKEAEKKLAKISEEQNFLNKNRFRLQKTKLDYADKSRMPVDEDKIKLALRNRPEFKQKLSEEIDNYEDIRNNPQYEYGILTYVEEAAYGDLKALIRDIGIHPDNLSLFVNFGDLQKERDKLA